MFEGVKEEKGPDLLRVKKSFKWIINFLMCKDIHFSYSKGKYRVQDKFFKPLYE